MTDSIRITEHVTKEHALARFYSSAEQPPSAPMCSPRDGHKIKRAPPEAQHTQTLTHIGTEPERESRDQPEAHAQTQTDVACLVSVCGGAPATDWQSFPHQEKSRAVYNEEALTAATTFPNFRAEGREVVRESDAVADERSLNEREDQTRYHRADIESPAARREEQSGEEVHSFEGSQPEGRSSSGAETFVEEQIPRAYLNCSGVSVVRRPGVAASTAHVSRTTQERADGRESVDSRETISLEDEEAHRERGPRHNSEDPGIDCSVETGLAPVLARGTSGGVVVDPPARREGELERRSHSWIGESSFAVVCHTSPPLSLGQSDGHALRSPASSDELQASPLEETVVDAEWRSRDAIRKDDEADDSKWTETIINTGKVDHTPKKEVEV